MASFGPGGKDGRSQDEIQRDMRLTLIEQQLTILVEHISQISRSLSSIASTLQEREREKQEGR